jgi:dihydrofolate synthase / folylpolyglutamate synthase
MAGALFNPLSAIFYPQTDVTYPGALALLDALPRWADAGAAAYKPGLERMEALMDVMGRPHERLRAVHVAGTNGKGSTASFVAAVGTASGRRVGLHTSPHLLDFAERLRLDGRPAPHAWIAHTVGCHRDAFRHVEPSYFEASVALSLLYFAEEAVDLAVVEVGLGGRLDATNVLRPVACGITTIGLDHTDLLGNTLPEIAREKAGIAKPGVPLLTSAERPEVLEAIEKTAQAAGASVERVRETVEAEVVEDAPEGLALRLRTPARDYGRVRLGLAGAHQAWNAALAVRLAEVSMPDVSESAVRMGLADVVRLGGLRGRCETWRESPRVVADVAHNADGWRAALACARAGPGGTLWALVGVMADKDADTLAALLAEAGATALPVPLPSARAMGHEALAERLAAHGVPVVAVADVAEGVDRYLRRAGPADVLLVTGSHLAVEALYRVR